jgi:hypothetical protein
MMIMKKKMVEKKKKEEEEETKYKCNTMSRPSLLCLTKYSVIPDALDQWLAIPDPTVSASHSL